MLRFYDIGLDVIGVKDAQVSSRATTIFGAMPAPKTGDAGKKVEKEAPISPWVWVGVAGALGIGGFLFYRTWKAD